jgi:hypothetical protein
MHGIDAYYEKNPLIKGREKFNVSGKPVTCRPSGNSVWDSITLSQRVILFLLLLLLFVVLRFELRAYTLSHSTSPIFVKGFFERGSYKLFALLASN